MNHCSILPGVAHPIIQAPMVGVSTTELAVAVSEAGGLGSIGLGAVDAMRAREWMREVASRTTRPVNFNVFCHPPAVHEEAREGAWLDHLRPFFNRFGAEPPLELKAPYKSFLEDDSVMEVFLEERPVFASFHFGLPPEDWIRAMTGAGITTMACVTSLEEASLAESVGVKILVAQGVEAGGHRGIFSPGTRGTENEGTGTLDLVRMLVGKANLPVIAAGGIMDGKGIAAALGAGAAGVQMGTAFLLCPESAADQNYRGALKSEAAFHTRITSSISGRPARGLPNALMEALDPASDASPLVPAYPIAYAVSKALMAAAKEAGIPGYSVQWAGRGAPMVREMPAADLIQLLVEERRQALPPVGEGI